MEFSFWLVVVLLIFFAACFCTYAFCTPEIYIVHNDPGSGVQECPAMILASTLDKESEFWWDGTVPADPEKLIYAQQMEFQAFRAYWGRGEPWTMPAQDGSNMVLKERLGRAAGSMLVDSQFEDREPMLSNVREISRNVDSTVQCCDQDGGICCVAPGWWQDFVYYSANNHPLHGIFSCSPKHRLGRCERIAMEISAICFCFFSAMLRYNWVHKGNGPWILSTSYGFSMFVVTIPGLIIWRLHWYLFTFPCGIVNEATSGWCYARFCGFFTGISELLGYLVCAGGIAFMVWDLSQLEGTAGQHNIEFRKQCELVMFSRMQSYIISWVLELCLYLNPCCAWGEPNPEAQPGTLAGLVGLGQWRIEKQRFQNKCIDALNEAINAKEEKPEPKPSLLDSFISP